MKDNVLKWMHFSLEELGFKQYLWRGIKVSERCININIFIFFYYFWWSGLEEEIIWNGSNRFGNHPNLKGSTFTRVFWNHGQFTWNIFQIQFPNKEIISLPLLRVVISITHSSESLVCWAITGIYIGFI